MFTIEVASGISKTGCVTDWAITSKDCGEEIRSFLRRSLWGGGEFFIHVIHTIHTRLKLIQYHSKLSFYLKPRKLIFLKYSIFKSDHTWETFLRQNVSSPQQRASMTLPTPAGQLLEVHRKSADTLPTTEINQTMVKTWTNKILEGINFLK